MAITKKRETFLLRNEAGFRNVRAGYFLMISPTACESFDFGPNEMTEREASAAADEWAIVHADDAAEVNGLGFTKVTL